MPCHDHTSKALRYGTYSQGISQFFLHTPCTSTNGMNLTCLCLPSRSWYFIHLFTHGILYIGKGKGKGDHTCKALRYGTCSQGISQFTVFCCAAFVVK